MKLIKLIEYLYLAFAAVFFTEAVMAFSTDFKKFITLLICSIIAILLYIYRKKRRINQENNQ